MPFRVFCRVRDAGAKLAKNRLEKVIFAEDELPLG